MDTTRINQHHFIGYHSSYSNGTYVAIGFVVGGLVGGVIVGAVSTNTIAKIKLNNFVGEYIRLNLEALEMKISN